ncbi:efflux RND transporter permease subunit [Iocasia frigidifontis]|nr:MMPL family transporter [Iocasia fonsfrigidae]
MIDNLFKCLARITTKKPVTILLITGIITVIMLILASHLNLELSWVALAPKGDPSQFEYKKILNNYPSASKIYITIRDKKGNPEEAARVAAERLKKLGKYVDNVEYKANIEYMLNNGMLLYKIKDQENITSILKDPNFTGFLKNLNDLYDRKYRENSNNIEDDKDDLARSFWGLKEFLQIYDQSLQNGITNKAYDRGINQLLIGDPYIRSIGGNTLLMTVQPTFGVMDYQNLKPGVNAIENEIKSIEKEYPNYQYGLTGMHVISRDELVTSFRDSNIAMTIGFVLIIIILIIAFKMWLSPLLSIIPLIVGIIWDMGFTTIIIGRLNIMTVFTAAMLIGLGIDFSVHILSGYTEARSNNKSAYQAIYYSLQKTGPGILTGALTTSAAFFALTISSLGLLVELGITMGIGILTIMLAVFFILPSILYLWVNKQGKTKTVKHGSFKIIGRSAVFFNRWKYPVMILILLISILMGWYGEKTNVYLNLKKIEPHGLDSIKVMDDISDKYDMSNDAVMYTTNNLLDTYNLAEELDDKPQVDTVSTITDYLPPESIQKKRLKELRKTGINAFIDNPPVYHNIDKGELLKQFERLNDNMIEMGQLSFMAGIDEIVTVTDQITGTPDQAGILPAIINRLKEEGYKHEYLSDSAALFYRLFSEKSKIMKVSSLLTIVDLPEDIRNRFLNKKGDSFLTSVYAKGNLWDNIQKPYGKNFIYMLRDKVPQITGSPIFLRILYDTLYSEVPEALLLVGITVLILLLFHFKSIKLALITILPLIVAMIVTVGAVHLLKTELDIFSVLAFPLIIGIGIDYGVHFVHHLKIRGEGLEESFSSVGRAVFLTTITTMASFGTLMIAKYRGIFRMGVTMFIGVALCFIFVILLIPIFTENKQENREEKNKF